MDLIGIENEAEFFPSGTLSDVLKDELQDITARWSGVPPEAHPVERLSRLAARGVTILRQLRNTSDRVRQAELSRDLHQAVVAALGYQWQPGTQLTALDGHPMIPVVSRVADTAGRDALWIVATTMPDVADEAADPLGAAFSPDQYPADAPGGAITDRPLEEILGEGVFGLADGPRNVLVLGLSQVVLVDKRKWPARSVLRFDLQEIFTRAERDTLTVTACLISREARVPEQGIPIADRLEEEAQRNANAVTTSLKKTVRDAIEFLGQEVLDVTGGKYPGSFPNKSRRDVWIDGPELSLECLRYMYRLLFLFYAEANPRLNILDLKNPVYATGYSLEALRELESVPLRTPTDRQGTYLWESLQRTLDLLYSGENEVLRLPIVKVALLDPASTPLLNGLRLRNEAIQKVIRLLSLRSSGKGTGRISYAKLGIGQLGAVYETLISFTGVVAKTDLIELKPRKGRAADADEDAGAGESEDEDGEDDAIDQGVAEDEAEDFRRDKVDTLAPSWFVPRSRIKEFKPEDVVFNGAEARVYPKGTFIYRLAGRDREKSASYYTPEPLARLLVKHALMERCKDLKADDILELKVLEPAMGSAAFLVETTNQLADLYLERKQKETGRAIPQDQVVTEKQKVRAYIADRNCFGVDLNPVAVELGAISLWLNGLHASEFSPWFGDQLHAGNSLIGARRASYAPALLAKRKQADLWLTAKPDEIGWRKRLPEGHVWQWLLPARDMCSFEKDKSITPFAGKAQGRIKTWRKGDFFNALEPHEVKLVQRLSRISEALFDRVAEDLARTRQAANDEITLWPDRVMPGNKRLDFRGKEGLRARLTGADHAANTLPYKRLKTAMDAWCSLWLWPLDKVHLLPGRAEFLQGMAMILEGGFAADGSLAAPSLDDFANPAPDLFDEPNQTRRAGGVSEAVGGLRADLFRETNVEALIETFDWLKVAVEVAERERFVHYDLIFSDVMKARGGFDVIVGNPPWAKPSWNEGVVLADIDPLYAGLPASSVKRILAEALRKAKGEKQFLQAFASVRGAMEVTSSDVMQPFVGGGTNNLYRCFLDLCFRGLSERGTAGLIHQDGHFGDPRSGNLREHWYRRIIKHFAFVNMIQSKNFTEVAKVVQFSLNIYRGIDAEVSFDQFTLGYLWSQVDECYRHDGLGAVPGLRGEGGKWETSGHRDRLVRINAEALKAIHELNGGQGDLYKTRFVQPYSVYGLKFIKTLSMSRTLGTETRRRLAEGSLKPGEVFWQSAVDLGETEQVKDGTITRDTGFHDPTRLILQGPHFFVANPLFKTPRRVCTTHASYDNVSLDLIPTNYTPRSNYRPLSKVSEFDRFGPECKFAEGRLHHQNYRIAAREMINLTSERSFIPALIPPGVRHVHTVRSVAFSNDADLLNLYAFSVSLVADAYYKMTSREHFTDSDAQGLMFVTVAPTAVMRALRLSCLTEPYAKIWNDNHQSYRDLPWSSDHNSVKLIPCIEAPTNWCSEVGIRSEYVRRLALVEIDVLVAMSLGMDLEQLIEIYKIYFPVLQRKERNTYFDSNGKIVWVSAKGSQNVGLLGTNGKKYSRSDFEKVLSSGNDQVECLVDDDTLPGGLRKVTRRFVGPFTTCDRVEDYKRAWAHFERLNAKGAP
jgi:hypothetical protein